MQTLTPPLHVLLALGLMLSVSCSTSREAMTGGAAPRAVKESALPGGRVRLTFGPVAPNPALELMELEEAQAVLTVFHAALWAERPEIRVIPAPRFRLLSEDEGWGEEHLREKFQSRFRGMLLPLPERVEQSRLYQALRLSPRYMGEGVREAARELFGSPVFLASVCLSVAVYFGAWLAPEPLLSKAFAVTLTAALALTVGMMEVANVALACLRLYWESQAAKTDEQLAAASERFGKAIGGTGLRVLVMVASMGVAKTAPTVPARGLGALLGTLGTRCRVVLRWGQRPRPRWWRMAASSSAGWRPARWRRGCAAASPCARRCTVVQGVQAMARGCRPRWSELPLI